MAVNDNDLALLQAYLDGEMPISECEGLWRRLAVEEELTAELDRLRAEAGMRQVVWTSLEPNDDALTQLQDNILREARRQDARARVSGSLRTIMTAAACIMIGIGLGWMGHDRWAGLWRGATETATHQASLGGGPGPTLGGGPGAMLGGGKFVVTVSDSSGRVVAAPQFNTFDEARQFIDDLAKAQANRGGIHEVVPAGDQF